MYGATTKASIFRIILLLLSACTIAHTYADELTPAQKEMRAAWQAAEKAMKRGPQEIRLRSQATLALPEGYGYVPTAEATRVMKSMGNSAGSTFIGLIIPLDENKQWFVSVDFDDAGYIKDDDAKDWNADDMLENLKEATEKGNEQRQKLGIPSIQVTRWIQSPTYDSSAHHLVWSAEVRLKNRKDPDPTINFNTYVLGREGYISMDLVAAASEIGQDKSDAKKLLGAVNFNDGKRYSDFDASSDKVAAYGLAALVGGVVAHKLGLLAMIGVLFAKFAKVIAVGALALTGGLTKFFKRKKDA